MSSKNLFLTGPSGAGKSTILAHALEGFPGTRAGFLTQRDVDASGAPLGFSLLCLRTGERTPFIRSGPAANQDGPAAAAPAEDARIGGRPAGGGTAEIHRAGGTGGTGDPAALCRAAERALLYAEQADLIILDEIGGIELASEAFAQQLLTLLCSGPPCLGVLKGLENSLRMRGNLKNVDPLYGKNYDAFVRQAAALCDICTVLPQPESREAAGEKTRLFLRTLP